MRFLIVLLCLFITTSILSQDYMMLGKTEKNVIQYRQSIKSILVTIRKDSSNVLVFYYTPSKEKRLFEVYNFKNKICVGYTEYYKNNSANKKYIKKNKSINNSNINVYVHKNKKVIRIDYIPTKKYLMQLLK